MPRADIDYYVKTRLSIAANIRAERARARLSQQKTAESMRGLGYSWHFQTVGAVERGERQIVADELIALAGVFGVPPSALWDVPPP